MAKCEYKEQNYDEELNYLIRGHNYYFDSKKEKFDAEVNYWLNIQPKIQNFIKK